MKMLTDKRGLAISCVIEVLLCLGAVIGFASSWPIAGVILLVAAVGFLLAAARICGGTVVIGQDGIEWYALGKCVRKLCWDEIAEIGVLGVRMFRIPGTEPIGGRYVYFSMEPLNDDERYMMYLLWPPRSRAYISYSTEGFERIQQLWHGQLQYYNISSHNQLR